MKKMLTVLCCLLSLLLFSLPAWATEAEQPPCLHQVEVWSADDTTHTGACTLCGETLTAPHAYGEGEVTDATCAAPGSTKYTCPCGHSYEESIPQLTEHSCDQWTMVDETTHTGTCGVCGETLTAPHAYGEGEVTDATCTAPGSTKYTCACGHSYEESIPQLTEHSCDQWTMVDETTHTGACTLCGETLTAPHAYGEGEVTDATCTAPGSTKYTCACGHSYEETIPQLTDHVYDNWEFDAEHHRAACIYCATPLEAAHILEVEGETAPTCQAPGSRTLVCSCGFRHEEELPQLTDHVCQQWTSDAEGHTGSCIHCQTELSAAHSWDEGVQTLAPTCTVAGQMLYTCTVCQHTRQEAVDATGHSYGNWTSADSSYHRRRCACGAEVKAYHNWDAGIVVTPPKCDALGTRRHTCTDCGGTKTTYDNPIPHTYDNDCDVSCNVCAFVRRTQHQYETTWTTDAETHWHTCSSCQDKTDVQAHTLSEWIVDTPAGEYTVGAQHKECTVCRLTLLTEEIPATGCLHGNEQLQGQVDATCTAEGYTGDLVCPRCQAVVTKGEPIPMLPHETQLQGQVDATCTAPGYTGDAVCTVCQNRITPGEEIPLLPHETQLQGQVDATCTAPGYTGDAVCTVCQNLITPGEEIPMLAHTTRLENAIRSDCTEAGYSGDEVCTVCGQTVVQGHALPLGDHRYEGGICLDCEGKDPNYIPPETAPGGIGDYEDTFAMSPIVIAGFAMLAVAFVGLLVLILLLLKKK